MKKFEYKYLKFKGTCLNSENTLKSLNELGEKGWQMVTPPSESSSLPMGYSALFVREIKIIRNPITGEVP